MTIYCVKRSNNTLAQAYFTQAEADAAALLIVGSTVVSVSLAPDSSTPPDMYVGEIITALQTVIDTAGGIVQHVEANPLDYEAKDADLPGCIYEWSDFVDTPDTLTEKHFTQAYQVDIYVTTKRDTTNTPAVNRAVAIAARNAIKATPNLGLGTTYVARPRRVTRENRLQQIFEINGQPREAYLIEVIVTKQEDET